MTRTKIVLGILCGLLLLMSALMFLGALGIALNRKDPVSVVGPVIMALLFLVCAVPGLLALPQSFAQQAMRRTALAANAIFLGIIALSELGWIVIFATQTTPPDASATAAGVIGACILGFVHLAVVMNLLTLGWFLRNAQDPAAHRRVFWPRAFFTGTALVLVAGAILGGVNAVRAPSQAAKDTARFAPGRILTFADLNFRFRMPDRPWTRSNSVNPAASFTLLNERHKLAFMVIAERIGPDPGFTAQVLRDTAISNATTKISDFVAEDAEPRTVAGIDGLVFSAGGTTSTRRYDYRYWVGTHNGYAYQLLASVMQGNAAERAELVRASDELFARFSLIDAEATVLAADTETLRDEESGLSIELGGSGWSAWTDVHSVNATAAIGAKRGATAAMVLIPVNLAGVDPHPDALAHALFDSVSIPFPSPDIKALEPYDRDGIRGRIYSSRRKVGKQEFDYRTRILRRGDSAWMASAWQVTNTGDPADLDTILDRVRLAADPAPFDPEKLPERSRSRQSLVLNSIGLYYYDKSQFPPALQAFLRAGGANPGDPVIARNTVDAFSHLGKHAEALAFLAPRIDKFPGDTELAQRHASLLARTKDTDGAITAFAALFESGWRSPKHLDTYIRLLLEKDQADRAQADLDRFSDNHADAYRTLAAAIRRKQGKDDEAIAILRAGLEDSPVDTAAAEDLIEIYSDLDRYNELLQVCDALDKAAYSTPYTLYNRGIAEMELDRLPAAKASFEAALRADPDDPTLKKALAQANLRLGQGDNSAIRTPIEPVPLPDAVLAGVPDFHPDAGAVYEHRIVALQFEPGKVQRRTEYIKARALDRRGLDPLSSFTFDFDSPYERIYVNSLEVRDESGAVVFTGDPATYFVTDGSDASHATQERTLHIPVGALAPGRTVSLVVTREDASPPQELSFTRHFFTGLWPAARLAVVIRADPALVRHRESKDVKVSTFDGGLIFSCDQTPVWRSEPQQPAADAIVPSVRLGAASETWKDVATRYLTRIAPRLELDAETKALAAKLTKGADDDEARILAIARHVQEDYTYKALAFGPRAQIPSPAREIIANRYGDCKDHALLAHLLLRACNIESHLVLVRSDGTIEPEVPANAQFDHVILHLPASGRFLDLTDKYTEPLLSPPVGLAGQSGLLLDGDSSRLVQIPPFPPDAATLSSQRDAWLEGRDLRVEERLTLKGLAAGPLRHAVRNGDADLVREFAGDFVGTGAELTGVAAENAEDPSKPLTMIFKYRVPGAFVDADSRIAGSLPYIWERRWLGTQYLSERLTPFELNFGIHFVSTVRLHVPQGVSPAAIESLALNRTSEIAQARRTAEATPDGLVIHTDLRSTAGRFRPDQYRPHSEFINQTLSSLEKDTVLKRK